jgi:hypothetical protein
MRASFCPFILQNEGNIMQEEKESFGHLLQVTVFPCHDPLALYVLPFFFSINCSVCSEGEVRNHAIHKYKNDVCRFFYAPEIREISSWTGDTDRRVCL